MLGVVALVGLHRADPVRRARQLGEQSGQLGVGALGDVAIVRQHFFRALVEELRIRLERLRELGNRPLEAGRGDDLVHLDADARDLGQPDVVHLLRGEVGGGAGGDQQLVESLAAGKLRRGELVPACRQVLRLDECLEGDEGGLHAVLDHGSAGVRQALALVGRNRRWKILERGVERGRDHVGGDERTDLAGHALHRHARRHPAGLDAGLERRGGLRNESRQRLEALEVIVVVAHGVEGCRPRQRLEVAVRAAGWRDLQPPVLPGTAERQVSVERGTRVDTPQVVGRHRQRYAVLHGQRRGIEGRKLDEYRLHARLAARHGLG